MLKKLSVFSLIFSFSWQIYPAIAQANSCQSATYCVHNLMPIWSQADSNGYNVNGPNNNPPLLQYVQSQENGQPGSDPGWCLGVASAMILKSFGNEVGAQNCPIPNANTYSWITGANPSIIVFNTFGVVGTNIIGGGTFDTGFDNLENILSLYNGVRKNVGLTSVNNYINTYNRPFIGIAEQTGAGGHALTVYGVDGQYHIIADPWGSTYDITANQYDVDPNWGNAGINITYVGDPNIGSNDAGPDSGGPSELQHYGPVASLIYVDTFSSYQATPPRITVQPASQTVNSGNSVVLSVQANGIPNPTYQWSLGGQAISGATSSSYSIASAQSAQAGTYSVLVANCAGTVTSSNALLTVNSQSAPSITTQPINQTVNEGSNVTLSVVATGLPALTYQWQYSNGSGYSNLSGAATTATLSLSSISRTQQGSYRVIISNSSGSVTSNSAALTVNYGLSFTTQPQSQTVQAGQPVTFTSLAIGNPTPTYQWQFNNSNISGATTATLSLPSISLAQQGSYRVIASNSLGSITSNSALLTINSAPAFTTQPQPQTVQAGQSVTFSSLASGNPSPTYQWKFNNSNISGATSPTYTIQNVTPSQQGSYQVVATNSISSSTSLSASLTVQSAPTIIQQPSSQMLNEGQTLVLAVQVAGSPILTYQWQFNNGAGFSNIMGATSSTWTLDNIKRNQQGSYRVIATNSGGSVTSIPITVTVNYAPEFTVQPASLSILEGQSGRFTGVATGNPAPDYQWQYNGVNIGTAVFAALNLVNVSHTQAGNYQVIASNSVGSAISSVATLTVSFKPQMTAQPPAFIVPDGSNSFSFSAQAIGYPAPQIQWYFNGLAIAGATTQTLTINSDPQTNPSGTYFMTATNSLGSVSSNSAEVGLNPGSDPTAGTVSIPSFNSSAGVYHYYQDNGIINQIESGGSGR